MFKNYLKVAFRNLWKNKGYSIVNILGLSIGLAVCLLIFLFIRYEMSFDHFHKNKDRIYRIVTTWKHPGYKEYSQGAPAPLAAALKEDFPGIQKVAAVIWSGSQVTIPGVDGQSPKKFNESNNIFIVQPEFYEIFNFPWLYGNPETALKKPNTVALTKSIAEAFFGNWHNAIGKSILIDNHQWMKVTGIIKDLPKNTDLPIKIAVSYATVSHQLGNNWQFVSTDWHCYVLLKKNINIDQPESRLPAFIKKYYPDNTIQSGLWGFVFQPLQDIHFNTKMGSYGHQINPKELIALGIVGLFILLIACINFINMSTAQSVRRAKEVGIRKVLGSRRKKLMLQFLCETMLITAGAMLMACILTELTLPWIRNFFDQPISFDLFRHPVIVWFLVIIVLITGLLAGLYPAFIMSGFEPVTALKAKIKSSGNRRLRETLVIIQFAVTLIIVIGMWLIIKQMNFFRNQPMGFDQSAISLVSLPGDSMSLTKYNTFKNTLVQLPGIENMSLCYSAPSSQYMITRNFSYNNTRVKPFGLAMKFADTAYFHTFGLQLIAGRIFHPGDTMKEVVVNQTLLKKVGVVDPQEAVGKYMIINDRKATIVGVVKDFVNYSLANKISPTAITTGKSWYGTIALKLNPGNIDGTMRAVKKIYNKLFPQYIYNAHFFDQQIADYYIRENRLAKLFKVFAIIVLFISTIGLLSLLSFITAQRTKEIAIRKVLGASGKDILQLIGKGFMVIVIIANMIAWPVAYILAKEWLNGFAYRIEIPVWPFVITAVLSMVLTLLIIGVQIWSVLKVNSMKVLKDE